MLSLHCTYVHATLERFVETMVIKVGKFKVDLKLHEEKHNCMPSLYEITYIMISVKLLFD